jgi:hypothetical protein
VLAHHAPSLLPILPHFNPSFPPFPHAFSRRLSVSLPPRIPRGRWNKSAPRRLQPKRTTRKKSQRPCILHNRGWEEDENGERLTLDERRHGERERRTGEERGEVTTKRRVNIKGGEGERREGRGSRGRRSEGGTKREDKEEIQEGAPISSSWSISICVAYIERRRWGE